MTEQELIARLQAKLKKEDVNITREFKREFRESCKFFNFKYNRLAEKLGYRPYYFSNMLNVGKPVKPFMTELINIYKNESKKK